MSDDMRMVVKPYRKRRDELARDMRRKIVEGWALAGAAFAIGAAMLWTDRRLWWLVIGAGLVFAACAVVLMASARRLKSVDAELEALEARTRRRMELVERWSVD